MSEPGEFGPKALLVRLHALEAENVKLKDARIQSASSLIIVETKYNGHSMLEFRRGDAAPFSIGVKKLQAIQEGWDEVVEFLKNTQIGK